LLHHVVWLLKTNVLDTVLPPSSGLKCVEEIYLLHCHPPTGVINVWFVFMAVK